MRNCDTCGTVFTPKPRAPHQKFCSNKCGEKARKGRQVFTAECKNCGVVFHPSDYRGKFCSRSCSTTYNRTGFKHSSETKAKISSKISAVTTVGPRGPTKDRIPFNCPCCNETIQVIPSYSQKTCGKPECISKMRSTNTGGYREGSGSGKSGFYKGIFCNSTYELAWTIHRLDHGLPVERFPNILTDGKLKYLPDYLIAPNHIVEIKGFDRGDVRAKTKLAESLGYKVDLLFKDDLQEQFQWVRDHYTFTEMQELYDNHKPKFTYTCGCCGVEFSTERKRKKDVVFCSKSCSMKVNHRFRKNLDA